MIYGREKKFISYIRKKHSKDLIDSKHVLKSFGEDCAVLEWKSKSQLLVSCDDFIEGRHYKNEYFKLRDVGRKALLINISDIVSMGGIPLYYLVSLHIPKSMDKRMLSEIYKGFSDIEKDYKVQLIGGNTEAYFGPLAIGITIIGKKYNQTCFHRCAAKTSDKIFITNNVGFASLGLSLFKMGWRKVSNTFFDCNGEKEKSPIAKKALKEFLLPSIPFHLSKTLAQHNIVNAAIDISDGLVSDLYEICKESNVSAILYKNKLPINSKTKSFCRKININFEQLFLSGGEDYQLLFTVAKKKIKLLNNITKGCEIYCIGEIIKEKDNKVKLIEQNKEIVLSEKLGFDQFLS